jgi:hypothetical protein
VDRVIVFTIIGRLCLQAVGTASSGEPAVNRASGS